MHTLQHREQFAIGLAGNPRRLPSAARPDIAGGDRHGLTRQANEPLDVVDLGVFRIPKDDHVPPLRLGEVVGELVDQDPVAVKRRIPRVIFEAAIPLLEQFDREATVGAGAGGHELAVEPRASLRDWSVIPLQIGQLSASLLPFAGRAQ